MIWSGLMTSVQVAVYVIREDSVCELGRFSVRVSTGYGRRSQPIR